MADNSAIEWTDATWNPITGCSVVSPGCKHCYAMRLAGTRLQHHPSRAGLAKMGKEGPVWTGEVKLNMDWMHQPVRWRRPRMIFVCAHGDLFHENVPDEWIDRVFAVMGAAPQHTFQVLTKRAERMRAYMARGASEHAANAMRTGATWAWPLPNVWLGVSAEDQPRADERLPFLLATPAAVRWVSAEPLLGPIRMATNGRFNDGDGAYNWLTGDRFDVDVDANGTTGGAHRGPRIDWVVAGGESGPGARAMHPDWARSLRDQCKAAGVAFHFKQHGEFVEIDGIRCMGGHGNRNDRGPDVSWLTYDGKHLPLSAEARIGGPSVWGSDVLIKRVGKKAAGRLLDGREHNGMPGGAP